MAALYKEQLGELIAERRTALGLTQAELAEKIPVKESQTVSRWERGERGPNDLDAVARALQTTAAEMLSHLGHVKQSDRKRLSITGETQLDRIEGKLDWLVAAIQAGGGEHPEPPGELGRRVKAPKPKPQGPQRAAKRPAKDDRRDTA